MDLVKIVRVGGMKMPLHIDKDVCTGCGICQDHCPEDVLKMADHRPRVEYPDECWLCGSCMMDCPSGAIKVAYDLTKGPFIVRK